MRFRNQLIVGAVLEIALVVVICAMAVVALGITRNAKRETRRALETVLAVHQLRSGADQLVVHARGFLLTNDKQYVDQLASSRREFAAAVHAIGRHSSAYEEVTAALTQYFEATQVALRDRDSVTSLAALESLYERRMATPRQRLKAALVTLERENNTRVDEVVRRSKEAGNRTETAVLVGSAIAIGVCVLLCVLVARRLSRQFQLVQQSEHAASKSAAERRELLDIVSHDLRTPLSTIALGLDALREEHGELQHLRPIENAMHRMRRLVDDLLDTARAQTTGLQLELSTIDSYELLLLTVESFAARAKRAGIELRIEHPTHAELIADRDRVLQILANLVGNAFKVTSCGGTIALAASPGERGIRFSVRDSGPGIDHEQVPALFDAYRQGASAGPQSGLGLGLYISRTLTRAHGGDIGVETNVREGSTFWFELPQKPAAKPVVV